MSSTKHQHFIPRSYLRNFAIENNGKFFVEAKSKLDRLPKEKLLSIRDICVDKNIYTLPLAEGEEKYALEKFYAENIDGIYPEIYRLLVNPDVVEITPEQKIHIVMIAMSLFFRTPKFLNVDNKESVDMLQYAVQNYKDDTGNVKVELGEYSFDFHVDNIENELESQKMYNKMRFLNTHLEEWHLSVQGKVNCGISVFKVSNEVKLITSDNPVAIHSIEGKPFNIFDPSNIIRLPLDPNHFLVIFPETEENNFNRIYRSDRDERFAVTTNHDVDASSETWILGIPGSIRAHIEDQIKYDSESPENLQYIEDMKEKVSDMQGLMKIVQEVGGFAHQMVADKVKELRKKPINKNNSDMQKIIDTLAEHGFITE